MQEKSDRKNDFLGRFDALCLKTGMKTAEACRSIGIARSLFYELRSGKRDITDKMLNRLAMAERQAGLSPPLIFDFERASDFAQKLDIMRRASDDERLQLIGPTGKQAIMETRVEYVICDLEPLLIDVETLADSCAMVPDLGSESEFTKELLKLARAIKRKSLLFRSKILELERTVETIRDLQEATESPKPES